MAASKKFNAANGWYLYPFVFNYKLEVSCYLPNSLAVISSNSKKVRYLSNETTQQTNGSFEHRPQSLAIVSKLSKHDKLGHLMKRTYLCLRSHLWPTFVQTPQSVDNSWSQISLSCIVLYWSKPLENSVLLSLKPSRTSPRHSRVWCTNPRSPQFRHLWNFPLLFHLLALHHLLPRFLCTLDSVGLSEIADCFLLNK